MLGWGSKRTPASSFVPREVSPTCSEISIYRSPSLPLCKLCSYVASSQAIVSLRAGTRLSQALQARPVLSQLTLKFQAPSLAGYTNSGIQPLWISRPDVIGFCFSCVVSLVLSPVCAHSALLLRAAPDHPFCPS